MSVVMFGGHGVRVAFEPTKWILVMLRTGGLPGKNTSLDTASRDEGKARHAHCAFSNVRPNVANDVS